MSRQNLNLHCFRLPLLLLLLAALPGCLSEQNFPPNFSRLVHVANQERLTTRAWVARMHLAAAPLLPSGHDALTTDQLADGDHPTDVWKRFDLNPDLLDSLWFNLRGIEQTAQTVSPTAAIVGGQVVRPAWPGFHDVDVPVPGATLSARLGAPEPQYEIPGSFVILTHGLFGTLDGNDVINHVQALRRAGHHVLAIEMRGHGQTKVSHPEYAMTFGVDESRDLLAAAHWLKSACGATRVGLVSFSLTGFESLLTAWLDTVQPRSEFPDLPLRKILPPREAEPAFNGGMFIVSAPVAVMDVASRFETRYSLLEAPVKATFQDHVAQRIAEYKGKPGYTMWDLARSEFSRSDMHTVYPSFEFAQRDLQEFLDLSRDDWKVGAARMEDVRVPLLILNAANDPLASAQGIVNLFSRQHNPNIGVILLKEGGHIGFTAYSADYYYSLMTNFFDPATAPVMQ